ncbi:MAG: DUF58 domain-containing protein [Acidobacteria bacterium]|nr:DUF58 domain-containing protein [Acidobacteriota bacterium]
MAEDLLIDTRLLEKLERLTIQWQKSLGGLVGGDNTSRFGGAGQEFLDHRQFHHGDELRDVNWRAFMRLEKLFLKVFHLEPRIPVRILFDVSPSMATGAGDGTLSKFDYARKLAAAVCYVGLVRLDSITLQPFSDRLGDGLSVGGGRQRFQPAVRYLSALKPGGKTNFLQCARDFLTKFPQAGLTIVISDFFDEADCDKPLQYLADFGHELILIQVWADDDREPAWEGELDLEDAESGARLQLPFGEDARVSYTAAFDEFSAHLREVALRNGGRYVSLSTSTPVEDAIFGPMVRSGALQ